MSHTYRPSWIAGKIQFIDQQIQLNIKRWVNALAFRCKSKPPPVMIFSCCIMYHGNNEKFVFHKPICNEMFTLSDDRRTITNKCKGKAMRYAYGEKLIPSKVKWDCIWKVRIQQIGSRYIQIGLSAQHNYVRYVCGDRVKDTDYLYETDGATCLSKGPINTALIRRFGFDEAEINDAITIRLDLKNKRIEISVNDRRQHTFKNIETGKNINYRLMVSLAANDSVKIEEYNRKS